MKTNQFLSPASWTIAFLFTFLGSTSDLQHFVISLLLFSSCKTSSLPLCIHFLLSSSWMFFAYCIFSTSFLFFSSSHTCICVSFHNTHPSCRADSLMSSISLHYTAFISQRLFKAVLRRKLCDPWCLSWMSRVASRVVFSTWKGQERVYEHWLLTRGRVEIGVYLPTFLLQLSVETSHKIRRYGE